uniref:Uncharacterized protein n=1 Tax=Arundo donax TaxID=35708 RepID=A0A0A9CRL6_ARUDO
MTHNRRPVQQKAPLVVAKHMLKCSLVQFVDKGQ